MQKLNKERMEIEIYFKLKVYTNNEKQPALNWNLFTEQPKGH